LPATESARTIGILSGLSIQNNLPRRSLGEAGMTDRSDIETAFQFIDADEGRLPKSS